MKFKHIHIKNFFQLVPNWAGNVFALARELDKLLDSSEGTLLMSTIENGLPAFWVEADLRDGHVRIAEPSDDGVNNCDRLIIKSTSVIGDATAQIEVPLVPIFKGFESIDGKHVVYLHSFQTETPLGYIGVSKRPWHARFSQHISSSKSGSPYLFHRAILEHRDAAIGHKVLLCNLDYDVAMGIEEEFVGQVSLYPLGLNMIPGGSAGIRYLHKLGIEARNAVERDKAVEDLAARETLDGRPNPLCAARWASDPNFVERVICGHSGRLTAEQVRAIRLHSSFGFDASKIKDIVGARSARQVARVLSGQHYSRIVGGSA